MTSEQALRATVKCGQGKLHRRVWKAEERRKVGDIAHRKRQGGEPEVPKAVRDCLTASGDECSPAERNDL